jgi:hypothetical protein
VLKLVQNHDIMASKIDEGEIYRGNDLEDDAIKDGDSSREEDLRENQNTSREKN